MRISFFSIPYSLVIQSNQTNYSSLNLPSFPLNPGFGLALLCPGIPLSDLIILLRVTFGTLSQAVTGSVPFPQHSVPPNYHSPVPLIFISVPFRCCETVSFISIFVSLVPKKGSLHLVKKNE